MALSFRSASQNSSPSGSAVSVAKPTGAATGDLIKVIVQGNGQITISDNNGSTPFTKETNFSDYKPNSSNGHTVTVFKRVLQAGDPATFNFSLSAAGRWGVVAVCLTGNSVDDDVAPNTANAANEDDSDDGTISAPAITVANNTIHIVFCGWDTAATGTITTPSGYTLAANANGGGEPLHVSYKVFTTGGDTGAVSIENSEWGAMIAGSFSVKETASGATATPPVASAVFSLVDPAIAAGAGIVAAIASAVFSIPTPTPSGGANIAPAVQSAVFSVQSPTIIGGASAMPSIEEATFSVQAPTLSGGGVATPSVAEASFSAPTASASGGSSGNAEATPGVAIFTVSIQSPTVSGGGKTEPGVLVATFSIPVPTQSGGGTIAPTTLLMTLSVIAPALSASAVATPSVAELTFSVPTPTGSGGGLAPTTAPTATFEVQTAVATGEGPTVIAEPGVATLTISVLSPASAIGGATAYPQPAVIGAYKLIYLIESDRYALRITGNMYLEL